MENIKLDDLQLAIMQSLWNLGEASVNQLREALAPERDLAHTTIGTILNRLERKGLVGHQVQSRQYVYKPLVKEAVAKKAFVSNLVEKYFKGSPADLASYLIKETDFEASELAELRRMIDGIHNSNANPHES